MAKKKISALNSLLKSKFETAVKDVHKPLKVIPSGSLILDKIMGVGGYPMGRVTEVYGPYSSGKTTIALQAIRNCQKVYGKVSLFMDFERSFNKGHAEAVGVTLDETCIVLVPDHLEHGESILQEIFEDGDTGSEIGLIVFDSVSAMQPKVIVEGDAESKTMGAQARELARFMSKYSKWVAKYDIATIVLNQERTNIKTSQYEPGPSILSSGGKALQFYNSIKIHLKQISYEDFSWLNPLTGKTEKKKKTSIVRATCMKNKVAEPFQRGDIIMTFGKGVDNGSAIINIAIIEGRVSKSGAMYTFTDISGKEEKIRGKDNVVSWFEERPKELKALEDWFKGTSLERDEEAETHSAMMESGAPVEDDFNVRE